MTVHNLTVERLHEVLDYDPETGLFTWLIRGKGITRGSEAGRQRTRGVTYKQIKIDQVSYQAHRLVWLYMYGRWPEQEIDHINSDMFDNRLINLRECSRSQNNANRRQTLREKKYSPLKGVSFYKNVRKWASSIKVNGRTKNLGMFATPEEAHAAYMKAANELFGEFARAA